jgi:hypothetical protein
LWAAVGGFGVLGMAWASPGKIAASHGKGRADGAA